MVRKTMERRPIMSQRLMIAVALLCMGVAGGCGSSPTSQMKDVMRRTFDCNGKRLAVLYGRFMNRPLDRFPGALGFTGPASESEFKSFISSMSEAALAEIGGSQAGVDGLFLAEKTQKPLEVRYGITGDLATNYYVVFEPLADGLSTRVFTIDGASVTIPAGEADAYRSGSKDVKPAGDGPESPAGTKVER